MFPFCQLYGIKLIFNQQMKYVRALLALRQEVILNQQNKYFRTF